MSRKKKKSGREVPPSFPYTGSKVDIEVAELFITIIVSNKNAPHKKQV